MNKSDYGHVISVAPMMDYTDKHFRYLLRLISKRTLLYTEMITAPAILHGDRKRLLVYHNDEHPIALQLGGSDPNQLAECARIAEDEGYDEINLNVGCPSSRVQEGRFGACLMKEPELVAACIAAMQSVVNIPVTVKTRIGVDDLDEYAHLHALVNLVSKAGCQTFILHARKAWLKGLSPKENRSVPPLSYETVYQLKQDSPHLNIVINGGIETISAVQAHLKKVDGVMLGRKICQDPYFLANVDALFYDGTVTSPSRAEVLEDFQIYLKQQVNQGERLTALSRHLLGLFYGTEGARAWRRKITESPEVLCL